MPRICLSHRLALATDIAALGELMDRAITELQKPFLTEHQIAASRALMGLDRQLIEDQTYFVVECDGVLVGCGGWSFRQTLYGSGATPGRKADRLDPGTDPARIRAMYTHPAYARNGVATLILALCETASRSVGFRTAELMSTLAGEHFYRSHGYSALERVEDERGGAAVPLIRMRKPLA